MTRNTKPARPRKRPHLPRISVLGVICMILLMVPTARGDISRIEYDRGSSEDGGVIGSRADPLDGDKDLQSSQLKRVAIIGGGIGGISTAHFLINDENRRNLTQITIFEKEPQFGGRIHFTQIYDHGTAVNTAGHTFDADDSLVEEMANVTSIHLQKWPHDGWNTESRSFLYLMSKVKGGKYASCPAGEQGDLKWMDLARLLRRNVADLTFWRKYLGYIRLACMENGSLNRWDRIDDCGKRTNLLLLAGSQAKAGQNVALRSRIAFSEESNGQPQKQLQWNQHDRIFTGLLGDLYDHTSVTMHLDTTVTRVTRYSNGSFGVSWAQTGHEGHRELDVEQFDNVIIATPFHQAELEIEPPPRVEPEKITYAPIHVTSFISQPLPDSILLQAHGERWRTSAAFLWPTYLRHRALGLNATSLPFISVARERTVCYIFDLNPHVLTRVVSGEAFSDGDIVSLFHARENVTFPRQSCFVPQQTQPDLVHPKYDTIREEFALEDGALNKSTGCVERPTIAWIYRDYWPDGLPIIKKDEDQGDSGERSELVPGLFYVNGFEGREGASVSKSLASGRKVKDLLFARYAAG